ncbi:MAG: GNAT family N-acetyltransferase [Thermaceae bacterium]|nr:GNAT family N-acetyltransferase [Thermaceae bacterium]
MNLSIRPFTPHDYPAIAHVRSTVWPDNPVLPQTLRNQDERMKPGLVLRRLVAENNGRVVGYANFSHMEWMYHPQKFWTNLLVHPEHQRQGIGSALYEHLMNELRAFDPIKLSASTREDKSQALRFMQKHGFKEEFRAWESRLDLAGFEPEKWAGHIQKVLRDGYEIKSLAELEGDPQREREMYALDLECSRDVPLPPGEAFTFPDLERYWQNARANTNFRPEMWFLAVKDGEYAGVSQLFARPADHDLNTGFTAVKPTHRRHGVALALKLTALEYAKGQGKTAVRTENAQVNRPMLSINERLGFEKLPAWIDFAKVLKGEA